MSAKTWYAAKKIEIQGKELAIGDVLGTGEGKGFSPAKGLEGIVLFGHIKARINYGTVSDVKPEVFEEAGPEEVDEIDISTMKKAQLMDLAASKNIDLKGEKDIDKIRAILAG